MFILEENSFKYIIAARDDLTHVAERRALRKADAKSIAKLFWEEIICQYRCIAEVVIDNSLEVKGVFEILLKRYNIPQIRIFLYNKHVNEIIEQNILQLEKVYSRTTKKKIKE